MSKAEANLVREIDRALECKGRLDPCHCQVGYGSHWECDGCRIKRVLKMARVAVIQGAEQLGLMQLQFIGFQDEIVAKLREIIATGKNGGKAAGFEEVDGQ